jgi:hypothetical protein
MCCQSAKTNLDLTIRYFFSIIIALISIFQNTLKCVFQMQKRSSLVYDKVGLMRICGLLRLSKRKGEGLLPPQIKGYFL